MENELKTYCRLCAEPKPLGKMLNLSIPAVQELFLTLKRLNLKFLDVDDPYLPQNVCIVCSHSLESALNTVRSIETAQSVLKTIFVNPNIKHENGHGSDDEEFTADDEGFSQHNLQNDLPKEKQEYDLMTTGTAPAIHKIKNNIKLETSEVKTENVIKLHKKKRIKKESSSKGSLEDDIPLSKFKSSWSGFTWVCSGCDLPFTTCGELINHSTSVHDSCALFKCSYCGSKKLSLKNFIKHAKTHLPSLKYSCYKCFATFQSAKACNVHKQTHNSSPFNCPCCYAGFDLSTELIEHQTKYMKDDRAVKKPKTEPVDRICQVCNRTFSNLSALKAHKQLHLIDRKREYVCEICGKGYYNKNCLKEHSVSHQDERPFQCQICSLSFRSHLHLRRHVSVHESVKPFSCEKCGKCFRLQKSLTSHSIVHTDQLPHVCNFCNKAFKFKTILNQHVRQHTGVKPYRCDPCDRDFTNWPNYNKHMKRKHGMNMSKKKIALVDGMQDDLLKSTEEWKRMVMGNRKRGRPKTALALVKELPQENQEIASNV